MVTLQIFDGNILMDRYRLSPYTCKCCTVLKQFDGLNCDGLAQKCQKRQNFPLSKFCAIQYYSLHCHVKMEREERLKWWNK